MATTKTAAPSGCSITRNGDKFTLTWKIKAKNSKDGQKRRHFINGKKSNPVSISKTATKTSITTSKYPLSTVTIQIQDNQDGKKTTASNWAGATFTMKRPPKSIANISLSNDFWNVCNVSYTHSGNAFSNDDKYGYIHTERQTVLQKEGTTLKESDWKKNDGTAGIDILKKEANSFTKQEASLTISKNIAYARKFRFRIKAKKGYTTKKAKNAWVECVHYYSIPYTAQIKEAKISKTTSGGIDCSVKWYSPDSTFHPIDYTTLQYGIAVPGINLSCPSDISWNDRPTVKDTKTIKDKDGNWVRKEDGDLFHIDTTLDPDYCLFVRVKNTHDMNSSYSVPKMATGIITPLYPPVINGITPDYTTNRVSFNVSNESSVPDSYIAIVFKSIKNGESTEQIVGVLPKGVSETTIQCPNLEDFDEWSFGAFAFVGDVGIYSLTEDSSVVSGKKYYTRTGSETDVATVIDSPSGNPHELGYYEKYYEEDKYFLSEDLEVNPNTTYYDVVLATPYEYTLVANPTGNPHSLGYYEFVPNASTDISYTMDQTTVTYSVYEIPNIKMQSNIVWQDGDIPRAPANVKAVSSGENVALVTWDWAWKSADIAELSWSDHEDAWESTNQPETYRIPNTHSGKWYIYGLEAGVTWYIKVRLIKATENGENQGPWGSAEPLDMTSAPNRPVLECSKAAVSIKDSFTLSWDYISTDGTDQKDAMLTNVTVSDSGEIIYGTDVNKQILTNRTIDLTPEELEWSTGERHGFVLSVISESNRISEKSDPVWITVADPISCTVTNTSFKKRPLYSITTDTEIDENQSYYTLSATEVTEPDINDISVYYELVDGSYILTDDGVIDDEKTYYTVIGTLVNEPSSSSLSDYYIKAEVNILDELPLTLSAIVTGGSETGKYNNILIERASAYFVDRPDETTYQGYEGETVYSNSFEELSNVTINQSDLIGYLDDTAFYYLTVSSYDDLGQSDIADPILFMVNWAHQATVPSANVEFDSTYNVMKITPSIDPEKYQEGDTFDIYRLSIDKPVLIVKGGQFNDQGIGETYVDPYPTIGRYGGHRVVTVTANGDFISNDEESDMAWTDLDEDDGDIFNSDFSIINYKEGIFEILYNADLSTDWKKDFRETRYLGGHIQGDWNDGVSRTSTINSVMLREDNFLSIQDFRRLAEYTGICHVRTLDGSNYYADIQVNESVPYDDNPLNSYTFKLTRVDSDGYDGIELSEWNKIIGA